MLELAYIGCGSFATNNHLKEILKRSDAEISAIVDSNQENLKKFQDSYNNHRDKAPHSFNKLTDLLGSNVNYDAAVICTPVENHASISSLLLENGKHIYVEKPFMLNTKDAEEVVELADRKGLHIMIGANRCVFPAYRAAAKSLSDGDIGQLKAISILYKYPWQRITGGWRHDIRNRGSGLLLDHFPHYAHFLVNLNYSPELVQHVGTRRMTGSEDLMPGIDIALIFQMQDRLGVPALIAMDGRESDMGVSTDGREEAIRLYGEDGRILIRFEKSDKGYTSKSYLMGDRSRTEIPTKDIISELQDMGIFDSASHPALIHNFIALLSGKTIINASPGFEGVPAVRMTSAIDHSREGGHNMDEYTLNHLLQQVRTGSWIPQRL